MTVKNYYAVLGLDSSAEMEVVEVVYKTLANKYHPDSYEGDKGEGEERLMAIEEAYQTLSDPTQRKKYDHDQGDISKFFKVKESTLMKLLSAILDNEVICLVFPKKLFST